MFQPIIIEAFSASLPETSPAFHLETSFASHPETSHPETSPASHLETSPASHLETSPASHPETSLASHPETDGPFTPPPLPVLSAKPEVDRPYVPQGRKVSKAYAIVLDDECIRRWAIVLHEMVWPGELSQLTSKEAERLIRNDISDTPNFIVGEVYREFPHLPRLKRSVVAIRGVQISGRDPKMPSWLLVFKDNSGRQVMDAAIEAEDIKAVKEFLGVMKQGARWYDVSRRVM